MVEGWARLVEHTLKRGRTLQSQARTGRRTRGKSASSAGPKVTLTSISRGPAVPFQQLPSPVRIAGGVPMHRLFAIWLTALSVVATTAAQPQAPKREGLSGIWNLEGPLPPSAPPVG